MSYQEKKTIVSILSGLALLVAYCIYGLGKVQSGLVAAGDLRFWAIAILKFIGIGIIAMIIIQIVFHILLSIGYAVSQKLQGSDVDDMKIEKTLKLEMVEDEMDKLIELKSMRVGFGIAGVGFVTALVALVLGYSPVVMLNIMFASFSVGSMTEGITQLYFYRRGVKHE